MEQNSKMCLLARLKSKCTASNAGARPLPASAGAVSNVRRKERGVRHRPEEEWASFWQHPAIYNLSCKLQLQ